MAKIAEQTASVYTFHLNFAVHILRFRGWAAELAKLLALARLHTKASQEVLAKRDGMYIHDGSVTHRSRLHSMQPG
jgi:topoisomerase IA-like protein